MLEKCYARKTRLCSDGSGGGVRQRRFSNVGDAVSRKLSTTMGWRAVVSVQEVVTQAKSLAGQFIKATTQTPCTSKKLTL